MIKQLENLPNSGQYEEILFDLADSWRGKNWHYVLFTMTNGQKWCGHFRGYDSNNFLTAVLESINVSCVISGGQGYIIDIDNKVKIKDIDESMIISLSYDNPSSSFIISTYWDIRRIDSTFNETEISLPIKADGIHFMGNHDGIVDLEIEEIGPELNMNRSYYIDLTDCTIKRHRS